MAINDTIDYAIREMAKTGVADGSLRECDPADVSRALFGAFNGIPVWYRAGGRRTPGRIADDFMVLLLAGAGALTQLGGRRSGRRCRSIWQKREPWPRLPFGGVTDMTD